MLCWTWGMCFTAAASSENDHGSNELGLDHRPRACHHAVKGCAHPAVDRVADAARDVRDLVPGIALVPEPVERLGDEAELDQQVLREVRRLDLAPLLPPQAHQGGLIRPHDDSGVRAPDEGAALRIPIHRQNRTCEHLAFYSVYEV